MLSRLVHERQLDRHRAWLDNKASYPRPWRDAAHDSEYLFYLTPSELEEIHQEIADPLLPKFHGRLTDPAQRPAGSAPVEMLLFTFPLRLPAAGSDSEPGSEGT